MGKKLCESRLWAHLAASAHVWVIHTIPTHNYAHIQKNPLIK